MYTCAGWWVFRLGAYKDADETSGLFLFFLILPLCNAVFDFLSFGVTRLLLWRSMQRSKKVSGFKKAGVLIGFGIADFCAACLLLIALAFSIITLMHWFNLAALAGPAGAAVFDIGDKLSALTDPSDLPQWIYVMHFSTFLPSVIHLCVVALALPNLFFEKRISANMALQIEPSLVGNPGGRVKIALWQSARQAMRLAIPIAAIYIFVTFPSDVYDGVSAFATLFLGAACWYAEFIGAL